MEIVVGLAADCHGAMGSYALVVVMRVEPVPVPALGLGLVPPHQALEPHHLMVADSRGFDCENVRLVDYLLAERERNEEHLQREE